MVATAAAYDMARLPSVSHGAKGRGRDDAERVCRWEDSQRAQSSPQGKRVALLSFGNAPVRGGKSRERCGPRGSRPPNRERHALPSPLDRDMILCLRRTTRPLIHHRRRGRGRFMGKPMWRSLLVADEGVFGRGGGPLNTVDGIGP